MTTCTDSTSRRGSRPPTSSRRRSPTPIYGKLSDIFGRRPLFIFAIGIFLVGSLAASFSDLDAHARRVPRAAGPRRRWSDVPAAGDHGRHARPTRAGEVPGLLPRGLRHLVASSGRSSAALFAGADQILFIAGWRWVFLINVPIGIIALLMVLTFLHLPKFGDRGKPRIDWWGATLVIVTLVPLLLIAEQGREWGWDSPAAFACYAIGGLGLIAFIIVERAMGDDAILPMKLFGLAGVLDVRDPRRARRLRHVRCDADPPALPADRQGLTPTESGFAMLPMVLGLMISSIASGQIISRTGNYQVFPITGTAFTAIGFLGPDVPDRRQAPVVPDARHVRHRPRTRTAHADADPRRAELGVSRRTSVSPRAPRRSSARSAARWAPLSCSPCCSPLMPTNISAAMQNESDLKCALNAALTPSVANASKNQGVMDEIWTKIVDPVQKKVQDGLDQGTAQAKQAADAAVTKQVTAAVQQQVAAGTVPAAAADTIIAQQVDDAKPAAEQQALERRPRRRTPRSSTAGCRSTTPTRGSGRTSSTRSPRRSSSSSRAATRPRARPPTRRRATRRS